MTEAVDVHAHSKKVNRRKRISENVSLAEKSVTYSTVPLPPCKVCSGAATGYHFGVITCEACKAFFRRALIHKQPYTCFKDDNCEIIYKKISNCSSCRLRKCFELGMSKSGVRRGRYSIAIRTQAIVEAKASEGKGVSIMDSRVTTAVLPTPPSISPPSISSSASSSDSSPNTLTSLTDSIASLEALDGLLELSGIPRDRSVPVRNPEIEYHVNQELEHLIDAVISCQSAVYPNLKKVHELSISYMQLQAHEDNKEKQKIFEELFGKTNNVSTEEFQRIFAETGIDVDDRLANFNRKGRSMEESISQYVTFAKIIPGFKNLKPKDVSKLLKASHLEFWIFGNYMLFNKEYGLTVTWDGTFSTPRSHVEKFFDKIWTNWAFNFADSLQKLNLSVAEIAIIRVIILTYTDRCQLVEREKIQMLQYNFLDCLHYQISKTYPNPGRRLCQIFDRLMLAREFTELNTRVNKKFLQEWGFLMHDFPLWKEMLSFDEI